MKAVLAIVAVGLVLAGIAALGGLVADRTLSEEKLALDPSRANLNGPNGSSAYRIELERLGEGHRVNVTWEFRNAVNGTLTVRRSAEVTDLQAPPLDGALLLGDGPSGNMTFVAPDEDAYALIVQTSHAKELKGAVLLVWDPVVEAEANPIYLGLARVLLVTTGIVAVAAIVAGRMRNRRR